ncbi:MAG TPA: hypothetical protein VKY40_07555 [Halanaerobiales bacterium]|nr:hypothetical protein [Halanaerobiales bacterium]
MVSVVLIIIGIVLTSYGFWGIIQEEKHNNADSAESEPVIKALREELKEFREEWKENRSRLSQLTLDMANIYRSIPCIEKETKESNNKIKNSGFSYAELKEENFRELLNEEINSEKGNGKENNVPSRYLRIMRLKETGLSTEEIAEKMDLGVRETDLILRLYGGEKHVSS